MKKKIILVSIMVFLFSFPSWGQLQKIWSKQFTFGALNGQPFSLSVDGSGILASGYAIDNTGGTMAGIIRFSTDGDTLWSKLGENWSKSIQTSSIRVGNYIFWVQGTNGNDNLVQMDLNGNIVRSKQLPYKSAFISAYGDSLVMVSGSTVAILDTAGSIVRSASYATGTIGGSMTLRIQGDFLTITAIRVGSQNSGLIARVNLVPLSTVWERDIQGVIRCFADVDSNGNTYFAGSELQSDGTLKIRYLKVDLNGTVLVDSSWYPRDTQETNYENWIDAVGFYDGIVVASGSIQSGNTHTSSKNAYFATLNSTTGEKTWDTAFSYGGNINQIEDCVFASNGDLFVLGNASYPYRNWLEKYKLLVTDVSPEMNVTPKSFELSQNYPNPFNPTTSIKYKVVSSTYVRLTVYDMLGREVAVLVDEEKPAGGYTITFDGSNLSSGVYFYRLQTSDGYVAVKKMNLLK